MSKIFYNPGGCLADFLERDMPRKTKVASDVLVVYRTIGDNIISARGKMTQEELAQASGVSRSTIIAAESGRGCSLESLVMLAKALGKKPADFFVTGKEREEVSYQAVLMLEEMKKRMFGQR